MGNCFVGNNFLDQKVRFPAAGAYATFSARGGGGCALDLSGPHVSSPFLLREETSFCVRKIRNIIVSICRLEIASPEKTVQS